MNEKQFDAHEHLAESPPPPVTYEDCERRQLEREEELQRLDDVLRREEKRLWPDAKPA